MIFAGISKGAFESEAAFDSASVLGVGWGAHDGAWRDVAEFQQTWSAGCTRQEMSSSSEEIVGMVAGFVSFSNHAGALPQSDAFAKKLGKTKFQATTILAFWAVSFAKCIPYTAPGIFTTQTAVANLVLAYFALHGT